MGNGGGFAMMEDKMSPVAEQVLPFHLAKRH